MTNIFLHKNNEVKGILLKVRWNRKADWQAVESPKKQTDEFDFFAVKSKKSKQNFFWGKLAAHTLLSKLTDL